MIPAAILLAAGFIAAALLKLWRLYRYLLDGGWLYPGERS